MSKMSEIDLCIGELRQAAGSLNAVADSLTALFSSKNDEPATPKTEAPTPKPKEITLEQVRIALAEKSRDGFTAEVKALLTKHGANRLSEVDPANYAALLSDAEGIKK